MSPAVIRSNKCMIFCSINYKASKSSAPHPPAFVLTDFGETTSPHRGEVFKKTLKKRQTNYWISKSVKNIKYLTGVSIFGPDIRPFFQAEAGIRDWSVTGVQTCALPI